MILAMTAPAKPPDAATDADLVRAFVGGDTDAFERLVDRHQRAILHLCQRLVGPTDAADLFQEIFLQCWRSLAQLRAPEAFRAWLLRIAVRRARRRRARQLREPQAVDHPDQFIAPPQRDLAELTEDVARLRMALALLPDRQREVVVLRHDHGLTFAEIAAALEIREDAARANHYQGLKRLRRELQLGDDERRRDGRAGDDAQSFPPSGEPR
jgi:RNA polymerase sigma-70 factor (ECF subfamily)